jgi:Flp pilus assembly protein TadG
MSPLRIIWCDLRGTTLVEGAVLLPMLFVAFFGVFEFSWYFYQQHQISTGIRDAARYIARSDNLGWPPTIPTSVSDAAKSLATTGDTSGSCPPTCNRVSGWAPINVSISVQGPVVTSAGVPVYDVLVSTTGFTPSSLGILGFLKLGPFSVTISHYERLIPPPVGII